MKYLSVYNEYPLVSISYDAALTLFQHFPNAYYLTSSENTTCDTVFLLRDIRKMFHCSSLNELQLPPMMTLKEPPCTSFFTTNNKKYFYHALQNHFDDFVMMIKFQSYENSYSGFLTKYFIPLLTQTIPSSYFSLYEFLMSQCLPYSHFFENFVTCFSEKLVEIISSCECNPTSTFQNFYDSFIELKTTLSQVNSSFIHPSTDCLDSPSIHGKLFLDDEVISNESPDSTPLTPIVSTISVVPLSNFNLTDFSSGCICVPSIALSISCSDMSCDFTLHIMTLCIPIFVLLHLVILHVPCMCMLACLILVWNIFHIFLLPSMQIAISFTAYAFYPARNSSSTSFNVLSIS